jgi:adenosylcobinamide-phosphate synthase
MDRLEPRGGLPSLLAFAIHVLLSDLLGWPFAALWSAALLYVTLGFRQFSHHFTDIRDALDAGDEDRARELLAQWRQADIRELPRGELVRCVIEYSVLQAHRHVFGVLAWYSVLAAFGLGPAGAVLYRSSEFVSRTGTYQGTVAQQPVSEAVQAAAAGLARDRLVSGANHGIGICGRWQL